MFSQWYKANKSEHVFTKEIDINKQWQLAGKRNLLTTSNYMLHNFLSKETAPYSFPNIGIPGIVDIQN